MTEQIFVCPECGEPLETRREVCPMCGATYPQEERSSEPEATYPVNSMLDIFCFTSTMLIALVLTPIIPVVGGLVLLLGLPLQAVVTNDARMTLQKYGPDDPRSFSARFVRSLMRIYAVLVATLLAIVISFFCVCIAA